jgi:hypothetical protein
VSEVTETESTTIPKHVFQGRENVDWREHDEEDPDDEEMAETPPDVVMILGFDPKKEVRK